MPTIQLKLTDEEYKKLIDSTPENTGIKAAMFCINGFSFIDKENDRLVQELSDLKRIHSMLQTRVSGYFSALSMLEQSLDQ
jgi:hypothetical protein